MIDRGQFKAFSRCIGTEFDPFARQVGRFGIGIAADRDIFSCRHRNRAGDEHCDAGKKNSAARRRCGGDPGNQADNRDYPVIGADYGGSQPADVVQAMTYMVPCHVRGLLQQPG